jgi:elongation factor P
MATRRKDMIIVNDLRPGITFVYENNIYSVIEASHNKTAMRQMIIKAKARNLRSGSIIEISFTGGDKVEPAHIDKKEMQYLYDSGDALVFMDTNTYEQIEIQKSNLTWELNFLKPNDNVNISSYENEILGLILPDKVTLQIIETEPAIKGDTATNALKNATVETGLQVRVPMFIEQDEYIIVNTSDGKYHSRA